MKTICNKLYFLICSAIILPFLGGGVLSAQSDELLGDGWNFIEGYINGQAIQSPANFGNGFFADYGGDPFFEFIYGYPTSQCFALNISYFNISNSEFYLDEIIDIQTNTCQGGDILDFIDNHNSFFVHLPIDTNGTPKNPFNYTIVSGNPYDVLTITNNEGDWVKYGGTMLSISVFNPDSFTLYPNPVGETLFVNTTFDQVLQAKLYDINGKLLQSNVVVDASQTNIDIRQLNAGLYFVVFENEAGERVSRKFVKQ